MARRRTGDKPLPEPTLTQFTDLMKACIHPMVFFLHLTSYSYKSRRIKSCDACNQARRSLSGSWMIETTHPCCFWLFETQTLHLQFKEIKGKDSTVIHQLICFEYIVKFRFNELLVDLLPRSHRWLRYGLVPFKHQGIAWSNDGQDVWRHMASLDREEGIIKKTSNLQQKPHLSRQWNYWSLRCSWSIAYRRCPNHIFIPDFTPGFNGLGKTTSRRDEKHFSFGICCGLW